MDKIGTVYVTGNVDITSVGFCNIAESTCSPPLKPLEREILRCFDKFPEGDILIVQNTPDALLSTALFRAINKTKKESCDNTGNPGCATVHAGYERRRFAGSIG